MDLKPCPFCGDPPCEQLGSYGFAAWIGCGNHKCTMKPSSQFNFREGAAHAWNTRSPSHPGAQWKDALREALEAVRDNAQVLRDGTYVTGPMDAVNGPTYIIYGTTMNKVWAALAASTQGHGAGGADADA